MEAKRLEGFPLLDSFSIPEGGVCGMFASEAALELAQTLDPTHEVAKDLKEDHELMVPTSDEIQPSYAKMAEWKDWKSAQGVEVVTMKGADMFDSLKEAQQVYPGLDPEQNTADFTWAMRGNDGRMRFESWDAYKMLSSSLKKGADLEFGMPKSLVWNPLSSSGGARTFRLFTLTDGNVGLYAEGQDWPSIVATPEQINEMIQSGDYVVAQKKANAGGGLEPNDVAAPDGLPTKAEDEEGGQSMQNDEFSTASLKSAFPPLSRLNDAEKTAIRLAVMVDSDIAETPVDVLIDALDTIDNRRSGAEPTQEQAGYRTKILEELKNRGVEYKKASVDESVYQGFLDAMRGTGAQSMQEQFDVMAREMGLPGSQINEIAERLTADGFEVVAGRRPFVGKGAGRFTVPLHESGEKTAKKIQAEFGDKYPELDSIALDLESEVISMINTRTQGVESKMMYKAQYVLEELIKHLQADV